MAGEPGEGFTMRNANVRMTIGAVGLCALALGAGQARAGGGDEGGYGKPAEEQAPSGAAPMGASSGSQSAEARAAGKAATDQYAAEVLGTLHQDNQNEIQMGKLAQDKGQSSAVKEFGAMLVRDHSEADQKVTAYAASKNIPLERSEAVQKEAEEGRKMADQLGTVEGAAFDRTFAAMMVQDHQKAVDLVTTARGKVTDPELKALLGELNPVLKRHLNAAKKLSTSRSTASEEPLPSSPTQGRRPVSH